MIGKIAIGNTLAMTTPSWIDLIEIAPEVKALVTCRGETDESPYSGFNPCHYTGDSPAHIAASRKTLADYIGVSEDRIILPRQTHSNVCKLIDEFPVDAACLYGVDALVTRMKGVAIGVSTADCVPILLADTKAEVIAAVHAGWRGAVGGIIENSVEMMLAAGSDVSRIKAAIGPCICSGCFEVGEEVAERFPESCVIRGLDKPHVDLPRFVKMTLEKCGLDGESITMPTACTRCRPDRYFSARAIGINSGRNFSMIMLR